MIHHKIKYTDIGYPFGDNLKDNYPMIHYVFREFYKIAKEDLNKHENICIVCRGSSGSMVSAFLYNFLKNKLKNKNIKICHIKKEGEISNSHTVSGVFSGYISENILNVWVDDFICSGSTLIYCHEQLSKHYQYYYSIKATNFKFNYAICASISDDVKNKLEPLIENLIAAFIS